MCTGTAIYEPGVCHLGERCIADVWEIQLLKYRSGHKCCSLSSEGGRESKVAGFREVLRHKVIWSFYEGEVKGLESGGGKEGGLGGDKF